MARIINGPSNAVIDYPRLVRIRKNGKPMQIRVVKTDGLEGDPSRQLWIRFVSFVEGAPHNPASLSFDGYLSESYASLEERTFDEIDPATAQYVRGTMIPPSHLGMIAPWAEGTGGEAPGAEPFVIEWLNRTGFEEIVGVVTARSEGEAARLCGFCLTDRHVGDRAVYMGPTEKDGNPVPVRLTRLRDLPKFPLR